MGLSAYQQSSLAMKVGRKLQSCDTRLRRISLNVMVKRAVIVIVKFLCRFLSLLLWLLLLLLQVKVKLVFMDAAAVAFYAWRKIKCLVGLMS